MLYKINSIFDVHLTCFRTSEDLAAFWRKLIEDGYHIIMHERKISFQLSFQQFLYVFEESISFTELQQKTWIFFRFLDSEHGLWWSFISEDEFTSYLQNAEGMIRRYNAL